MRYPTLLSAYLLSVFALCVAAASYGSEMGKLTRLITQKQSTPEVKHQAIVAGQERALLCSACHGKDGNSIKLDVPNLASQNPVYLLDQIEKFSDGRRKNYVMNALAKDFTSEDKANMAIFYNSMPVKPIPTDTKLASQGKPIYEKSCSSCHGKQGEGNINFARIAGQQPLYVLNTLRRFRDNANNTSEQPSSKRSSNIMESIVKQYSDKELEVIATYITKMGSE